MAPSNTGVLKKDPEVLKKDPGVLKKDPGAGEHGQPQPVHVCLCSLCTACVTVAIVWLRLTSKAHAKKVAVT